MDLNGVQRTGENRVKVSHPGMELNPRGRMGMECS